MSILHELYIGNISPQDTQTARTEEYKELTKQIFSIEERLKSRFSKEEWALYEECCELMLLREAITEEELFTYGFVLGARMFFEILSFDMKSQL